MMKNARTHDAGTARDSRCGLRPGQKYVHDDDAGSVIAQLCDWSRVDCFTYHVANPVGLWNGLRLGHTTCPHVAT